MEEENGRHGRKLSGDSEGTPQWEKAFGTGTCVMCRCPGGMFMV